MSREFYSSEFDCSGRIVERFTALLLTLRTSSSLVPLLSMSILDLDNKKSDHRQYRNPSPTLQTIVEDVRLCRTLAKRLLYYWQMNGRATRSYPYY